MSGAQIETSGQFPRDIANNNYRAQASTTAKWVRQIVTRNFSFLHAKMIQTERAVMLGSANWSNYSIAQAMDVDVLLQTEREIHECYQLFELLWSGAMGNELTAEQVQRSLNNRGNR